MAANYAQNGHFAHNYSANSGVLHFSGVVLMMGRGKRAAAAALDCVPICTHVIIAGAACAHLDDVVAARQYLAVRDLLSAEVVRLEFFWCARFVFIELRVPAIEAGAPTLRRGVLDPAGTQPPPVRRRAECGPAGGRRMVRFW